jgi:multicomponent Na+:H+ antiporter subunit A
MRDHPRLTHFYTVLNAFMLSMLGVVLANDVITLFVFWELTSITSFFLIGFKHEDANSRRSALQALLITGMGGIIMLAGFLWLGDVVGSYTITTINEMASDIQADSYYLPILLLILAGAFTKSAQFPFHLWLPNAMAAPTPVSAYLHSATMVKAGVYLLARFNPSLGGTEEWMLLLTIFGGITAVYASVMAIRQRDLKQMLAYTTLTALGTITLFLGVGGEYGLLAAVIFILTHALYKATLFLVVGVIDQATGTRSVDVLQGLGGAMPFLWCITILAALSMAGMPPFIGFVSKEYMYKAALYHAPLATAASMIANILMVTVAALFATKLFTGKASKTTLKPIITGMQYGPAIMVVLGLLCGITISSLAANYLLVPATQSVAGDEALKLHLALYHGLNLPLLLSGLTLGAGLLGYVYFEQLRAFFDACFKPFFAFDALYDHKLRWIEEISTRITNMLQSGLLRHYMFMVFLTLLVTVGGTVILLDVIYIPPEFPQINFADWVLAGLIIGATIATLAARSKLQAICMLSVIGASVAILFLKFGAPDVAITQFFVETLLVVIVVTILLKMPKFDDRITRNRGVRIANVILSLGVGTLVTLLMLGVVHTPFDLYLTEFFEANSYSGGHGKNIVNVILVDFRATDTMGEIAVVAVAALAAYNLIKARMKGVSN